MIWGPLQKEVAFDFLTRTRTPGLATAPRWPQHSILNGRMARTKINAKQSDKKVLQLQQCRLSCFISLLKLIYFTYFYIYDNDL